MYFEDVEIGDKVFGLVYGPGEVIYSIGSNQVSGFYSFKVKYKNKEVFYTNEGVPDWCKQNFQTVFYKSDIDLFNLDLEPVDEVLKMKKIIKLRNREQLEMRCPSGLWRDINMCPAGFGDNALEKGQFHLFREKGNNDC